MLRKPHQVTCWVTDCRQNTHLYSLSLVLMIDIDHKSREDPDESFKMFFSVLSLFRVHDSFCQQQHILFTLAQNPITVRQTFCKPVPCHFESLQRYICQKSVKFHDFSPKSHLTLFFLFFYFFNSSTAECLNAVKQGGFQYGKNLTRSMLKQPWYSSGVSQLIWG